MPIGSYKWQIYCKCQLGGMRHQMSDKVPMRSHDEQGPREVFKSGNIMTVLVEYVDGIFFKD